MERSLSETCVNETVLSNHDRDSDGEQNVKRRLKKSPIAKSTSDINNATEFEFASLAKMKEHIHEIEDFVHSVWNVVSHHHLPDWMKDNDYLLSGHRPQLNSYRACFRSIFRIHSETGNIWTHLLGAIGFICVAVYILLNPNIEMQFYDHIVHIIFFTGAILCLSFSWLFHTFCCHSPNVGRLFSKLDYCGISAMVMASTVPWIYYGFYCDWKPKVIYITGCVVLGVACITVSLFDRFATAQFRPVRAGT